jgi:NADPH:quinone reductase-like Zn-dependent oxidoreductase
VANDLILDNVGNHSLSECKRVLNPKGICVIAGAPKNDAGFFLTRTLAAPVPSLFGSQKFVMFIAKVNEEDLMVLRDLVGAGKVTPVIDRCYKLSEAQEAIRYLEEGRARATVVLGSCDLRASKTAANLAHHFRTLLQRARLCE